MLSVEWHFRSVVFIMVFASTQLSFVGVQLISPLFRSFSLLVRVLDGLFVQLLGHFRPKIAVNNGDKPFLDQSVSYSFPFARIAIAFSGPPLIIVKMVWEREVMC